jgi:putative oxidoreductase
MNFIYKLEKWGDNHHPKWLAIVRVILGFTISFLTCWYVHEHRDVRTLMNTGYATLYSSFLAFYMILVGFIGGLLIVAGLITRISILFQLPVVLFAIISPALRHGLLFIYSSLPFAILVFLLLVFFFIEGSGPISMDQYLHRHHPEDL